jgi:hypothetical protein
MKLGHLVTLGWACLVTICGACGEQEILVFEAQQLPSPQGGSLSETPHSGGMAGLGGGPDSAGSPGIGDRGRVQVRDGRLLTDKGTPIRGVTIGRDGKSGALPFDGSEIAALSAENGLNAVHLYLENSAETTGLRADQADALVEMTSRAGMYLVLGMGGGKAGGTFDLERVRSFWTFYAPRYASRTHVLYEILNIPDTACSTPYKDETLAMEREVHELIRNAAPRTHVVLFSFIAQPTGAALEANLDALEDGVDWSQASVAFHTPLCSGQNNVTELLAVARARGTAALASEMLYRSSFDHTAQMENEGVSWFNFEWLVRTQDMAAFREAHTAAGISWCPDFGQWPEDSETCGTP